ncbi:MAK10-like protein [Tanacetum coccineum]
MERFGNAVFKQRDGINSRMTEMFGLLKELTTSRTPEKVLIREEAKFPITKNVNSISLTKGEEERSNKTKKKGEECKVLPGGPVYDAILKKKITRKEDIGGNFKIPCSIGDLKHVNALVDQGSDVNVMPYSTYMKLTDERPAETDIRLLLASHSYIYPLGITKDVLVEVVEHVYPVDFVILDIKENEKRPFILGTPFLTTAKASIKFDKGTITLRSGKSKATDRVVALTPGSAITIPETANEFAIKALFDRLLGEIQTFSQHENESLTYAWLRMKEMLQNCHGHNLSKGTIIKIFYHGLSEITQEVLNAAAGGIFLYKTSNQAYQLLEDKVLLKLDWAKNQKNKSSHKKIVAFVNKGNSNSNTDRIMARINAMTLKMDAQYKEL